MEELPRCAALDDEGKRCRARSGIEHHYFGNPEHYRNGHENDVTWVRINLCIKHAVAVGHDFTKAKP